MAQAEKDALYPEQRTDRAIDTRAAAAVALAVLLLLGSAALLLSHQPAVHPDAVLAADPYSDRLAFTDVTVSEATNGTGGKAVYVDGTVANTGSRTLNGAIVQVTFTTEGAQRRASLPLAMVRTRVPYVDLQPLSSAPLAPSQRRDFRLIFDVVPTGWNERVPAIQVIHADLR